MNRRQNMDSLLPKSEKCVVPTVNYRKIVSDSIHAFVRYLRISRGKLEFNLT